MKTILKINDKAFIRIEKNSDTAVVEDPREATQFDHVGDAMRAAVQVNEDLGEYAVRISHINRK